MISDYDLNLYWVSVLLRVRPFTVWFKTRIHLHTIYICFGFIMSFPSQSLHLCTAVMGFAQNRVPHKCAFHYPLSFGQLFSFRLNCHLYARAQMQFVLRTDSDFGLRKWRHSVLIETVKIITRNTNTIINKT